MKLGALNKRLIMPLISAVLYIIMDIIEYNIKMPSIHIVFDFYSRGISYLMLKLVPIIQKCKDRKLGIKEKNVIVKKLLMIYSLYI